MSYQREKALPSDIESEKGILGCILYNHHTMSLVVDILSPDDFCYDDHATIYRCMKSLYQSGRRPSLHNVRKELERTELLEQVGGEGTLTLLVAENASLQPIEENANRVKHVAICREMARFCYDFTQKAYNLDPNILVEAERRFYEIAMGIDTNSTSPLGVVLETYMTLLRQRVDNFHNNIANGIPTGFTDLDKCLGGLQPDDLYIVAARPSIGKTSLILNIALNIIQQARRVLFFSLEMSKEQLAQRLLSMETPMDQTSMRTGEIYTEDMQRIEAQAKILAPLDLHLDSSSKSFSLMRTKARRMHAIKPLQLIVVDYLQLMQNGDEDEKQNRHMNREQEVAKLSRNLKSLAMELHVPVVALAQLSRATEARQTKVPQLSDLRESGGIEADADAVMLLYSDEANYLKRAKNEPYHIVITVAKQRNGRLGDVILGFKPSTTKFEDVTAGIGEETEWN